MKYLVNFSSKFFKLEVNKIQKRFFFDKWTNKNIVDPIVDGVSKNIEEKQKTLHQDTKKLINGLRSQGEEQIHRLNNLNANVKSLLKLNKKACSYFIKIPKGENIREKAEFLLENNGELSTADLYLFQEEGKFYYIHIVNGVIQVEEEIKENKKDGIQYVLSYLNNEKKLKRLTSTDIKEIELNTNHVYKQDDKDSGKYKSFFTILIRFILPKNFYGWLIFIFIMYEIFLEFHKTNRKTTINSDHYQDTGLAKHILSVLSISLEKFDEETQLDAIELETVNKKFNSGIFGIIVTGAEGTGKYQALLDVIKDSKQQGRAVISFPINSQTELHFRQQIIKAAKKLGFTVLNGEEINYEHAVQFLSEYFSQHPGWLITFNNVIFDQKKLEKISDHFLYQFLQKLTQKEKKQSGQYVIAVSADVEINKNALFDFNLNENKIFLEKDIIFDLNNECYGFNKKYALRYFEKLTQDIYQKHSMTWLEKTLIMGTNIGLAIKEIFPEHLAFDGNLKGELVTRLRYSPHAIYLASLYIAYEYRETKQSPEFIISDYLFQLERLGIKKEEKGLIAKKDFSEQKKMYQDVNQAVYQLALEKLENTFKNHGSQQKIAELARQIVPLAIFLDGRYLHQKYIVSYLKRTFNTATDSEMLEATDLLCQLGLAKRYFYDNVVYERISPEQVKARDYLLFYIDSNCKKYYRDYIVKNLESNPMLYSLIPFKNTKTALENIKNKELVDEEKVRALEIQLDQSLLSNVLNFTKDGFHLKNEFLAEINWDSWDYMAHVLKIIQGYKDIYDQAKPVPKEVKNILEFVNPIMNISVQAGYVNELQLLYEEINKNYISKLGVIQPNLEELKIDSLLNKEVSVSSYYDVEQFCEKLFKMDPYLPTLYAQFVLFYARRMFKSDLNSILKKDAINKIYLANLMRIVIDNHNGCDFLYMSSEPTPDIIDNLQIKSGSAYIRITDSNKLFYVNKFKEDRKCEELLLNKNQRSNFDEEIQGSKTLSKKELERIKEIVDHTHCESYTNTKNLSDTKAFRRDSLGRLYIEENLNLAEKHYESILDGDPFNDSICYRFLADIKIQKIEQKLLEMYQEHTKKSKDNTFKPDQKKIQDLLQLIEQANSYLTAGREAQKDIRQQTKQQQLYAKIKRAKLVEGRLAFINAQIEKFKENPDIDSQKTYLKEAKKSFKELIYETKYDQKNDKATGYFYFAKICSEQHKLNNDAFFLEEGLAAIDQSLVLQNEIKIYEEDRELLNTYHLKAKLALQYAEYLNSHGNCSKAEKYAENASSIFKHLIKIKGEKTKLVDGEKEANQLINEIKKELVESEIEKNFCC